MITKEKVQKLIEVIDAGLIRGKGFPSLGRMCVEAAVCYAMGEEHGDKPSCVSSLLRNINIQLNDGDWSSKKARAEGLKRLAVLQLGTDKDFDEEDFTRRVLKTTASPSFFLSCMYMYSPHIPLGESRSVFIKELEDILIDMKVPGVQWLELLEGK